MKTDKKTNLVIEILLVIIAIYFISPFIYMFFSSLKTETEAIAYPPKLFPEVWRFSNYIEAWNSQPFNTFLLNTVLVTVLTTLGQLVSWFGSAYYIFLMRQFLLGVPKDFEEAARLDGANVFQIYWMIFMPILKPSLILVAVLNMISVWNDYLGPLVFLQDRSKYTLALGLAAFKGVHGTKIIPMLCITVIMIIPPILAFIFAQKYIVEGTGGAIKS